MEEQFEGFEEPKENWSKLPHVFIGALPLVETKGELEVILYILRHTWGFQDDRKKITLDEFANGRKYKNGKRIDNGTGLSIPTIRNGLKRAVEHGFITHEQDARDPARVKNFYSLRMNSGERNLHSGCKKDSGSVKKDLPRTEKETSETNMENEKPPLSDENNVTSDLPIALDGHQQAVDKASGGTSDDPSDEIGQHLYWGFMEGPVPIPRGKKEWGKWHEAGRRLLSRLPQPWNLQAISQRIDEWFVDEEIDNFWKNMPCKDEALDLIARYVIQPQIEKKQEPTTWRWKDEPA